MSQVGTTIVTQLVVSSSGATEGVKQYEAAMERAKAASVDAGGAANTFDAAMKKWTQSLGQTDPVLRASVSQQQALQRQLSINNQAVGLGITTQAAAEAQLEKVRLKYQGYITAAEEAAVANTTFGKASAFVVEALGPLLGLLSAGAMIAFAKSTFDTASALNEQAEQVGVSTDALQAYRAVLLENGIEAGQTDQILTRLTRSIGTAQTSSGPARDAFNRLGISLDTLKGGAEATLPAVADALLKIADPAQRAALEVDLFSRSGQKLESALHALIDPSTTLIEKEKALGQVMSHDLAVSADDAADALTAAWNKVKIGATPAIVEMVEKIAQLVDLSAQADKWLYNSSLSAPLFSGASSKADYDRQQAPVAPKSGLDSLNPSGLVLATGVHTGQTVAQATADKTSYNTTELDQYIAKQRLSASIAGQGPAQQAQTNALIEAANIQLTSGAGLSADQLDHFKNQDGTMRKFVTSTAEAVNVLGQTKAQEVEGLAATIQRGAAWQKVKQTYDTYLSSLGEEARLAGVSSTQRETELATIKAADIVQKSRGVSEKNLVTTYQGALTVLNSQQVTQIAIEESLKRTNALVLQLDQQQTVLNVGLGQDADHRALAVKNAQDELAAGILVGDEYKDQRAQVEAKNAAIQATTDAINHGDYMRNLREDASLAGLSADEREREAAVLQQMHATHGTLSTDQASDIRGVISARQETEKWGQVVGDIGNDFGSFFDDILTKGKLSFSNLFTSIEGSFAHLISQMAAEALTQPIIVPMVQEFAGTLGSGGVSGGTASNLLGLGSLGGGSDFLGIGSAAAGLGSALGFGTTINLGKNLVGDSMSQVVQGSLFGTTTLGGFLGGVGIGSLASSLVFGNKNDAGIGGMGGAAAGALAGSFLFPGVGTILGGLIGGLAGGGLGSITGTSNNGAIANFSQSGASNYLFKGGSDANSSSSTQAASTISNAISALKAAGVDVSLGNITGLSIGSDKSYVYSTNGGKQKLGGGDVTGVENSIFNQILPGATASTPQAQAILDRYNANGGINANNLQQLETDLGAAQQFADALNSLQVGPNSLSDAAQAIKQINDQIDPLVKQAQSLGLSTDSLETIRASALQALVQNFDDSVSTALRTATDPVGAQLDALLASEQSRLQNARDLGADVGQLNALNDAEMKNFFGALSLDQLNALQAANDITSASQAAFDAAQRTAQGAVNLANGFTNLGNNIDNLISQAGDAANAASQAASNWGSANDAVNKASTALLISDQSLSPTDAYHNAADQFSILRQKALSGDVNAANDEAAFASQFLQTSYSFNGSGQGYQNDLSYVQSTLADLAKYTSDQQTAAQRTADSAAAQVTLLQSLLAQAQAQTAATQDGLNSLISQVAASNTQIQQLAAAVRQMAAA